MDNDEKSVDEYLFTCAELLTKRGLSKDEADILRGRIEYFSALLGEEQGLLEYERLDARSMRRT